MPCPENLENQKAGFCHVSLKHETIVAKNVISSSTMSRSRRNGANRGRQAPRASQDRCWNTRGVARRQLTIATRKCAVCFEAASGVNRETELRAQDRKKLLQPERLLQHGASRMPGGEARNAVPRREKKGTSTRGENVGDRINPL